nr:hypothetical protein [Tanacetum cinerariifolium]
MLKEEIYNNERKLNMEANNIEDSNTEENKSGHKSRKTYANATKSNGWYETNKLLFVPTELNDARDEVVVFDEELVELGRMKKVKHTKLPIWVKLTEVLMEAWTTKGISVIRSSIGRPLIMDSMTAYVCKNGVGRTEYARVLVETDASKGLKELVKLQYRDKNQNVQRTKNVKVVYDLRPLLIKEVATSTLAEYNEDVEKEGPKVADEFVKHFENFLGLSSLVHRLDSLSNIFTSTLTNSEENANVTKITDNEIKMWMNGDVFKKVKRLRNQLKATKMEVNNAPHDYKIKEVAALTLAEYNKDIEKEVIKSKRNSNRVMSISNDLGNCVEGPKVADEFVKHFKNFLGLSSLVHRLDSLSNIFTSTLTNSKENEMVTEITDNEIKMVMFGIDDSLIPKSHQAKFVTEFKPISCCNVVYKNIYDNILLTQELLKGYNRKGGVRRCSLKIDISRAYDTVNSESLKNILIIFGFHLKMVDWIYTCVSSSAFSICVNDSVKVIKESLDKFNNVSGLKPNMSKSTIFFGNVKMEDHRKILNVMPFTVVKFHVKYLGVHLITKRLSMDACKQLLDKVKNKVDDWKNKFGDLARGKAKIAWKTLCKPKCQGGLVFKNLGRWNKVLLTKLIWNIAAHKKSLWIKWVHMVKLGGKSFWAIEAENNDC